MLRLLTVIILAAFPSFAADFKNVLRTTGRVLTNQYITLGALELSIGFDWRTTLACSNAGTCHEANPVLNSIGAIPGTSRFTAVKSIEMAGAAALYLYAGHRWPNSRKAFAIELWALTGAQSVIDLHNRSLFPKIQ